MSDETQPLPADHPLTIAWEAYKKTDAYANTRRWALHEQHVEGSLWACYRDGYAAGIAHAAAVVDRRIGEVLEKVKHE